MSSSISPQEKTRVISGLRANTRYSVRVTATNEAGATTATHTLTTLPHATTGTGPTATATHTLTTLPSTPSPHCHPHPHHTATHTLTTLSPTPSPHCHPHPHHTVAHTITTVQATPSPHCHPHPHHTATSDNKYWMFQKSQDTHSHVVSY